MKSNTHDVHAKSAIPAYRPQYEIVAEKIVEFITSTGMKSGDRLPTELGLGEQLGVSRSIVREAIKYLTATGLVAARKGVGVYVAGKSHVLAGSALRFSLSVDPEHMQSLFEFRVMQEMLATKLAAEQITLPELRELAKIVSAGRSYADTEAWEAFLASDDAFHLTIARATHNPFLVETIDSILQLQRWAVKFMTGGAPGSLRLSAEQHEAVFEAIRDGQSEVAARAVQVHVESALTAYRQEVRRRLLAAEAPKKEL